MSSIPFRFRFGKTVRNYKQPDQRFKREHRMGFCECYRNKRPFIFCGQTVLGRSLKCKKTSCEIQTTSKALVHKIAF